MGTSVLSLFNGAASNKVDESMLLLHRTNPCRFFFSIDAIRAATIAFDFFMDLMGLVRFCGTTFLIAIPVDAEEEVNRCLAC